MKEFCCFSLKTTFERLDKKEEGSNLVGNSVSFEEKRNILDKTAFFASAGQFEGRRYAAMYCKCFTDSLQSLMASVGLFSFERNDLIWKKNGLFFLSFTNSHLEEVFLTLLFIIFHLLNRTTMISLSFYAATMCPKCHHHVN